MARHCHATKEVHEDIRQVTSDHHTKPALLQVGVNQGVAVSSHQILIFTIENMEMDFGISVLRCKTKVNNNLVAMCANAYEKIVGLDVTVDEVMRMNILDAKDLICILKKKGITDKFNHHISVGQREEWS